MASIRPSPSLLATGVSIAAYSAIDRVGARLIAPLTYAAILWVTAAVALVLWVRFVVRVPIFAGGREQIRMPRSAAGLRSAPIS